MTWRHLATGSGTERWSNCPASVAMSSALKEVDRKDSDEGRTSHKAVHDILFGDLDLNDDTPADVRLCVEQVKALLPPELFFKGDGIGTVTAEQVKAWQDSKCGVELLLEQRLPLLGSSGGIDVACVYGKNALIFDFKFGVGVPVYAPGNHQLAFYACALKEKFPQITKVQVWVIQPNIEGDFEDTASITSWTLSHQMLKAWRDKISTWLDAVDTGTKLSAGPWCQFCKARVGCPAHTAYAKAAEIALAENPEDNLPALTPDKDLAVWLPEVLPTIARIYKLKGRMTTWFNKVEEFLFAAANSGHEELVKELGFEIYTKRANRKWRSEAEFVSEEDIAAQLVERGVKNPWKARELINLTAAEDEVNIDDLVYKPVGGQWIREIKPKKFLAPTSKE